MNAAAGLIPGDDEGADRGYAARNDESRSRLGEAVAALTAHELERPLDDGWTVKAVLAHLAYWDRYSVSLLEEWAVSGFKPDVGFVSDHVNNAGVVDWFAASAGFAVEEVLRAADAADALAASMPDDLVRAILDGQPRAADRSIHRAEHLEQVARETPGNSRLTPGQC